MEAHWRESSRCWERWVHSLPDLMPGTSSWQKQWWSPCHYWVSPSWSLASCRWGVVSVCYQPHRGIVSSGLYRLVRQPIYLGYFLSHGAFLLANANPWNLVVFLIAETSLVIRMGAEERVLLDDDAYERYHQTVRYRLVPGIY